MIIFISDFDLRGSGYMNIAIAACKELADAGHDIKALGLGYDGSEHNWGFSVIPVPHKNIYQHVPAMVQNFRALGKAGLVTEIEMVIIALDIPHQEKYLMMKQFEGLPVIGIFPVESGPLSTSWANAISRMTERLVISKFGLQQMDDAGVPGVYFPVGLDTEAWRPPSPEERKKIREAMDIPEDQFVVLTVADNQERKNLSVALKTIGLLKDKIDVHYSLVTREDSTVGWKLNDLATEYGIVDRLTIYERGLPFERLWMLFAAADAFLLTSKAEGLCMPIVEAMAAGVPVVATDCTALPEHLFEDHVNRKGQRGFPIRVEYQHRDPWGNSWRAHASPKDAAKQLLKVWKLKKSGKIKDKIVDPARAYAVSRTWEKATKVLVAAIERVKAANTAMAVDVPALAEPPTVPHAISLNMEGGQDE